MKATHTVGTVAIHAPTVLRRFPVKITVELSEDAEPRLSITGSYGTDRHGGAGQCRDIFDDETFKLAEGWSEDDITRLREVWKEWHLNNMSAGCEHQRAAGWATRPIDPDKPLDTYGKHFDGQRTASWNMLAWIRPDEHPHGLLTKPCEECGYRYGSAWLHRPIPAGVLAYVRQLAGGKRP